MRRAAEAVADGRGVPERLLEMSGDGEERRVLEQLRAIGDAGRRWSGDEVRATSPLPGWADIDTTVPGRRGPRSVAHRALRRLLSHATLAAGVVVPLGLLATLGWQRRHEPLAELFESPAAILLGLLATAAAVLSALREPLLRRVDGSFHHEPLDASRLLEVASHEMNRAVDRAGVATALLGSVERALRPTQGAVHLRARDGGRFPAVTGANAPLADDSALAALLREGVAVRVPQRPARSLVSLLPRHDQIWLMESGYRALLPLSDPAGTLLGFVGLGSPAAGTDYTAEDLQLVRALCGTAAVALGRFPDRDRRTPSDDADEALALVCQDCGRVTGGSRKTCRCGGPLQPARVPLQLLGRFALVRRLGAGAMGVVYQAVDTRLHRHVAIKTLPSLTSDLARRLRSEGMAMAALSHPNIAAVYDVEEWRSLPFLVMELLSRGSLAQRLGRGPLPAAEVRRLAAALGGALGRLHQTGYLHRDLKPTNVGFDAAETPKLLDLGLAHVADAAGATPAAGLLLSGGHRLLGHGEAGGGRILAGTPLYLPPEAFRGARPGPAIDLWALSVVLYECLTGEHPYWRNDVGDTLQAIARGELAEPQVDVDEALLGRLRTALDADPSRRPSSATELLQHLGAA